MTTLPLLPDAPDDAIVAYHHGRAICRAEFLGEVQALAQRLPQSGHVLNLCGDRYHFTLCLLAAMVRQAVSLLPNAITPQTLAALRDATPGLLCLCGHDLKLPIEIDAIRVNAIGMDVAPVSKAPQIPVEQLVARVFTSGSTGTPQAHEKYWGSLVVNIQAEAKRLWQHAGGPCAVLGTVPFQHMYGLESTVFLPLLGRGILCSQRPFFPADICAALAELPRRRMLVSTPFHLRTLLDAGDSVPPADLVLSATAPLALELAQRSEAAFAGPLVEIYGATETGQLATRQTANSELWHCFDGITLQQQGERALASGGHIEAPRALNDIVELADDTHFRLLGRSSDMVNVAGKRSSMAYLNHVLNSLPEVRDGVFCLPEASQGEHERLAAFVVAPNCTAQDILRGLREHLDPVFLPRPLIFLDHLPRNATGKITQEGLAQLIALHITHHD